MTGQLELEQAAELTTASSWRFLVLRKPVTEYLDRLDELDDWLRTETARTREGDSAAASEAHRRLLAARSTVAALRRGLLQLCANLRWYASELESAVLLAQRANQARRLASRPLLPPKAARWLRADALAWAREALARSRCDGARFSATMDKLAAAMTREVSLPGHQPSAAPERSLDTLDEPEPEPERVGTLRLSTATLASSQ